MNVSITPKVSPSAALRLLRVRRRPPLHSVSGLTGLLPDRVDLFLDLGDFVLVTPCWYIGRQDTDVSHRADDASGPNGKGDMAA